MEDLLVKSKFSDTEDIKNPSLDRLSCSELNILLERQRKLLNNSTIVNNLADKGAKIRLYISTLEEAIQVRGTYEETLQAISELKIEETKSPLHSPQANSPKVRRSLTDDTGELVSNLFSVYDYPWLDNEKLDKVRDKLASRPAPMGTQLLSGSDLQELVERDRGREESRREAEIRLGDFLGMFKVGNVKVPVSLLLS